jgi:hypothetical protein
VQHALLHFCLGNAEAVGDRIRDVERNVHCW